MGRFELEAELATQLQHVPMCNHVLQEVSLFEVDYK